MVFVALILLLMITMLMACLSLMTVLLAAICGHMFVMKVRQIPVVPVQAQGHSLYRIITTVSQALPAHLLTAGSLKTHSEMVKGVLLATPAATLQTCHGLTE